MFGHITYGGITPLRKIGPLLLFRYRDNLNRGSAVESVRYANTHSQQVWQPDDVRAALGTAVRTKNPLIAPAKTAQGLHFVATDLDWSHSPTGAHTVEGPGEDLLLAICGRPSALSTRHGDGTAELAARISR